MTDRELLELAAKAAEIPFKWSENGTSMTNVSANEYAWVCWNPLTDDGDGARLEAALGMSVHWWGNCATVNNGAHGLGATEFFTEHGGDKQAARRRASVIAAAAIAQQRGSGKGGAA